MSGHFHTGIFLGVWPCGCFSVRGQARAHVVLSGGLPPGSSLGPVRRQEPHSRFNRGGLIRGVIQLKHSTNGLTCKTEIDLQMQKTGSGYQGAKRGGIDWELGIDVQTLLSMKRDW